MTVDIATREDFADLIYSLIYCNKNLQETRLILSRLYIVGEEVICFISLIPMQIYPIFIGLWFNTRIHGSEEQKGEVWYHSPHEWCQVNIGWVRSDRITTGRAELSRASGVWTSHEPNWLDHQLYNWLSNNYSERFMFINSAVHSAHNTIRLYWHEITPTPLNYPKWN